MVQSLLNQISNYISHNGTAVAVYTVVVIILVLIAIYLLPALIKNFREYGE